MPNHNATAAREAVARHRLPTKGYAHRRESIAYIVRDAESAAYFVVTHTGDVAPGLAQVGYADAMDAYEEAASTGYPVRVALEGPLVPFTVTVIEPADRAAQRTADAARAKAIAASRAAGALWATRPGTRATEAAEARAAAARQAAYAASAAPSVKHYQVTPAAAVPPGKTS